MEERIRRSCNRTLDRLREELSKIKKKPSEEDLENQSGKDHGLSLEDNEDQKEKGSDDRNENRGENNNADGNEDTEDGIENENKKGEKAEKAQRAEKVRKEILQREDKHRRQSLESQIKEKEQEKEACKKRCEKAKSDEQELQNHINKYLAAQKRDRGKQEETDDEEDRLSKEDEKIAEWSGQKMRREQLQKLQQDLPFFRRAMFGTRTKSRISDLGLGSDDSELDDEFGEESNQQNNFKQLEKTLQDARALEDLLTNFRWLRDKADRKRDLRIVLGWERYLEDKWLKQVGQRAVETQDPNLSIEEKDHLTGNPLQDSKVYQRLGAGEVRLLLLMPSPKDCADYPLICALETHSWEKGPMPQYAALSYYWGPESENGRLYLLRGHLPAKLDEADWGFTARRAMRIPIRDNLFRALLRLRRHDHPVALWVDYLCIDQSNKEEKTEQLNNMVKVYHNAKNVCIWLGEGDGVGRSDSAMGFIPTIMDFAVLDRYAKDRQQAENWYALAELMRDRWFSRRWVVQEISLARSAAVHCGGKTVHWSDFADAVSLLASNQETIKSLFDYSKWREGPNTLGDVKSFGAYILLEATSKLFLRDARGDIRMPRTSLESLVTSLTTFDTSDRRDIIYSLVSIARDTSKNSGIYSGKATGPRSLVVDYKKTPIEVFTDFTKFCIKTSRSLDIICRPWAMPVKPKQDKTKDEDGDNADEEEGMPSWIPLLSNSEYGAPAEVYSGRKNGVSLVGPAGKESRYAASGKRKWAEVKDLKAHQTSGGKDHKQSIFVRGFKLAKIKVVSARNTGGVILQESLVMGSWTGIQKHDSVPDKIWRTLVADRDPDGQIPPTWYQRACMRCLEIADTFNNGDLNVGELLQGHSEMLRKYLTRVRNVTWNRTFFNATMTRVSSKKDELEKHVHSLDVVSEEHMDKGSSGANGVTENAAEEDEVNDSKDTFKERETGERDDASRKSNMENNNGINGQKEVPAIDGAETLHERPVTNGTEKLVEILDEYEMLDSEEAPDNEMPASDETADDYYLFGLGPPLSKNGDFVCILYGCSVPVILREMSPKGHYILVGEAYVHGKMDSEAITDLGRGKTWGKEETFELR
ncbi:HET domain containing protein [Hyaloscypha variabilis]